MKNITKLLQLGQLVPTWKEVQIEVDKYTVSLYSYWSSQIQIKIEWEVAVDYYIGYKNRTLISAKWTGTLDMMRLDYICRCVLSKDILEVIIKAQKEYSRTLSEDHEKVKTQLREAESKNKMLEDEVALLRKSNLEPSNEA